MDHMATASNAMKVSDDSRLSVDGQHIAVVAALRVAALPGKAAKKLFEKILSTPSPPRAIIPPP
jgi:hypothetical protein